MPIVVAVRAVWFSLASVSLIRWFKAHRRLAYGAGFRCWESNYSLRTCLGKIPKGNGISSITDVRVIPPWLGYLILLPIKLLLPGIPVQTNCKWRGRKVTSLPTRCTNRQCCCLPPSAFVRCKMKKYNCQIQHIFCIQQLHVSVL